MTRAHDHDVPGPDDLAPGWGTNKYTFEGQMQQLSMVTNGLSRAGGRPRHRMGWLLVLILVVLIVVPALFSLI